MPAMAAAHCQYVAEWVGTKLRWQLSTDATELKSLKVFADGPCEGTIVHYIRAP
jgi:hypothetical protein